MSLTGVIYGGIVVLWLCYLVPLALRRYDDAARSRSVERFSTAMRVLGRTEPGTPRGSVRSVEVTARAGAAGRSGRGVARRRRRVLGTLLALTAAVAVASTMGWLARWAPGVPAGAAALFLVAVRVQVARAHRRHRRAPVGRAAAAAPAEPAMPTEQAEPAGPAVAAGPVQEPDPVGDRPDEAPTEVLAAVATTGGGSLWDPLPVTLPTYVSKPRATRTVRTVDLGGPVVSSSGSLAPDDHQAPQPAEPAAQRGAQAGEPDRVRAVGD